MTERSNGSPYQESTDVSTFPHAIRILSDVAGWFRQKYSSKPLDARDAAIALRIAKKTDILVTNGGSPIPLEECTARILDLSINSTRKSRGTSLNEGILYVPKYKIKTYQCFHLSMPTYADMQISAPGPLVNSCPGRTHGCSASPHTSSSVVHQPTPCMKAPST